jgi:subtilisin
MSNTRSEVRKFIVVPIVGRKSRHLADIELFKFDDVRDRIATSRRGHGLEDFRPMRSLRNKLRILKRKVEDIDVAVLKEVEAEGPKLIETSEKGLREIFKKYGGMRFLEVEEYKTLRNRSLEIGDDISVNLSATNGKSFEFVVEDSAGGKLQTAKVIAFTNFKTKAGATSKTDDTGRAVIKIHASRSIKKLIVRGPAGFWSRVVDPGTLSQAAANTVVLKRLAEAGATSFHQSCIQSAGIPAAAGAGVRVGVIDTGIDKDHPSLTNVVGGMNLALEDGVEDPTDWGPSRAEPNHGTHVAGIIGGKPDAANNVRGVAPGIEMLSYRVVGHDKAIALNFDIAEAINRAVDDGCDIINLSMGGENDTDTFVRESIDRAADAGVLVVCAAGNSPSGIVYPAKHTRSVSVNAYGDIRNFPEDSGETLEKPDNLAAGANLFRANFAPTDGTFDSPFTLDFGGPGVGIVSTLPGGGFGPMSGSSMAAPFVSGFAAHLIASKPEFHNHPRNTDRWLALYAALGSSCSDGIDDPNCVGSGIPGL